MCGSLCDVCGCAGRGRARARPRDRTADTLYAVWAVGSAQRSGSADRERDWTRTIGREGFSKTRAAASARPPLETVSRLCLPLPAKVVPTLRPPHPTQRGVHSLEPQAVSQNKSVDLCVQTGVQSVECRGRAAPFPLLPLCCSHFLAQRDHNVSQNAPLTRPTTSVRSEIVTFRWSTIPLLHTTHRRSDASPVYALSSPSLTSPAPAQVFHLRIAAATGLSRHLIVCEGLSNSRRTLPLAATVLRARRGHTALSSL
eukprot:scaffold91144_cov67-Phaeocystis_antarctica.AAC.2